MHPREDPPEALLRLIDEQAGVVSAAQVAAFGLGRHSVQRLLDSGQWLSWSRGIYRVQADHDHWLGMAWAGVLLGGDTALVGGLAAGHLWGLVPEPPKVVLIWSAHQVPDRAWWQFRCDKSVRSSGRGDPPRISVPDTVLDLCESADDATAVVDLLSRAMQTRKTSAHGIAMAAGRRTRLRHRRLIGQVLAEFEAGIHSPLERRYRSDVERAHGLPAAVRQKSLLSAYRCDAVYEDYALIVELDGRAGHDGMGVLRDMTRDNRHLVAGHATLRYGSRDVLGNPCQVAHQVAKILISRGWSGLPTP